MVDAVARAMVGTASILAEEGDPNKCPKCKGKVFEAEKMQSNRGVFHKNCFKCIDCHRALDPSLVFDGFQVFIDRVQLKHLLKTSSKTTIRFYFNIISTFSLKY